MVITHNINEEQYDIAIQYIEKLQKEEIIKILYKYSHILMRTRPEKVENLLKYVKKFDATLLLSSLFNIPQNKKYVAVNILEFTLMKQKINNRSSVHNAYIFFLCEQKNKQKLSEYLLVEENNLKNNYQTNFNLDFALQSCKNNQMYECMITIYSMMHLWTDAVNIALELGMLEQAQQNANQVMEEELSKKLWLQIAKFMLNNPDKYSISEVIELTQNEERPEKQLKIDELLPLFDPNMKIEQFQGKISDSLKAYNEEITEQQQEMEMYSIQSDRFQKELIQMKDGYFQVNSNHKCDKCGDYLFQGNQYFYIFPCLHGYHQVCFFQVLKEGNDIRQDYIPIINDINILNNKIKQINRRKMQKQKALKLQQNDSFIERYFQDNKGTGSNSIDENDSRHNSYNNASYIRRDSLQNNSNFKIDRQDIENDDEDHELNTQLKEIKIIKEKQDQIIAQECLKCGEITVDMIYSKFNKNESSTWKL